MICTSHYRRWLTKRIFPATYPLDRRERMGRGAVAASADKFSRRQILLCLVVFTVSVVVQVSLMY